MLIGLIGLKGLFSLQHKIWPVPAFDLVFSFNHGQNVHCRALILFHSIFQEGNKLRIDEKLWHI